MCVNIKYLFFSFWLDFTVYNRLKVHLPHFNWLIFQDTCFWCHLSHPCLTCLLTSLPSLSHTSSLHLTGDAAFLVFILPSAFAAQTNAQSRCTLVHFACWVFSIYDYWYTINSCAKWYDGTSGVFVFPKVHMSGFGCFLSFLCICC